MIVSGGSVGAENSEETRGSADFWPNFAILVQRLLTPVEETIELKVFGGQHCFGSGPRRNGLLFDNLVVITSILIFQPVEDWKKKLRCRSYDSDRYLGQTFLRVSSQSVSDARLGFALSLTVRSG